jgi:putative tryptophan/tyrosine transport system substrate-binding protein
VRRREFITLLGGAAAAWPVVARAQQFSGMRRPLIGYLEAGRKEAVKERDAAFIEGMRDFGYTEGQSFDIIYRFADEDYSRLQALAKELVLLKPNVIVTAVTTAAFAAAKVTRTIPIVSAVLNDPVSAGVIASYAHPGGNVTGIMNTVEGLPGKLIEITLEVMPRATRIGILINPANLATETQWREIEAAATAKGIKAVRGEVRSENDLPSVFKALSDAGVEAVMVLTDTFSSARRRASQNWRSPRMCQRSPGRARRSAPENSSATARA